MDKNTLEELERAEAEAKDRYMDAQSAANEARKMFAVEVLLAKGIVLDETVCVAPRYGFSPQGIDTCKVSGTTNEGRAVCYKLKKNGERHMGQQPFTCNIDKLEIAP